MSSAHKNLRVGLTRKKQYQQKLGDLLSDLAQCIIVFIIIYCLFRFIKLFNFVKFKVVYLMFLPPIPPLQTTSCKMDLSER